MVGRRGLVAAGPPCDSIGIDFMRPTFLPGVLALSIIAPSAFAADADPPNIVFILIDDMGWRDVGFAGNTMLVFTSDNGGTPQYVAPLNGSKGALYEGGIRVPAAIWWKGIENPGRVSDEPILSMDFYPTLTELAGAKLPQSQPTDGVSLMSLLRGAKSLDREAVFWHFPCYIGRGEPGSAVRMRDWKLIEKFQDESFELYNLRDDIGEKDNLAGQNPVKLKELQQVLSDWQTTTNAPRPIEKNPAYDPAAAVSNQRGGGKKGKTIGR